MPAVEFAAQLQDTGTYVGRTSQVVKYIGATCLDLNIRFVSPASLGLNEPLLREKDLEWR
ncbi:MAG: hypothetical protein OEU36_23205 [Gammaproteobacteria bacterium]|nr:hypothetical protein [Gammaproteobacteria bacterium]